MAFSTARLVVVKGEWIEITRKRKQRAEEQDPGRSPEGGFQVATLSDPMLPRLGGTHGARFLFKIDVLEKARCRTSGILLSRSIARSSLRRDRSCHSKTTGTGVRLTEGWQPYLHIRADATPVIRSGKHSSLHR